MRNRLERDKRIALLGALGGLLLSGCSVPGSSAAPEEMTQTVSLELETENEPVLTVAEEERVPEEPVTEDVAEEVEEAESETVTIVMVGDILLHTPVEEASRREDGSYDYTAIFRPMREEIAAADLALVNQEVIIGGQELGISGYPAFNASYEIADALVWAGFDVVCQGTNHALDKGGGGVRNCLAYWEENYPEIEVLGIHDSAKDQREVCITEVEGIRIALLNYTYGTNGIPLPEGMPYAVDYLEEARIRADAAYARENADFLIVCPHWGTEYRLEADASQEMWTQIFADCGVDLVLGTHPHVIEPIEWRERPDGGQMLVYYSLGNFVNWTSSSGAGIADRMVGGMAEVALVKAEDGMVSVADYGVEALVCHCTSGTDGVSVYALRDYTEEMAAQNQITAQDGGFSLAYCAALCDRVWGELWQ